MNFQTTIKSVKISPKKLRFLVGDVRKHTPVDAIAKLQVSPWKGGKILAKAIKNTLDNAVSKLSVESKDLVFDTIKIDEGTSYKRMRPGPKGMANLYKKRTSHITVALKTIEKKEQMAAKTITKSKSPSKNADNEKNAADQVIKKVKTTNKKVTKNTKNK